jgi:hypothetical protein
MYERMPFALNLCYFFRNGKAKRGSLNKASVFKRKRKKKVKPFSNSHFCWNDEVDVMK